MGNGTKVALVALLILMVVVIARFVRNDSEEEAGIQAGNQPGSQSKAAPGVAAKGGKTTSVTAPVNRPRSLNPAGTGAPGAGGTTLPAAEKRPIQAPVPIGPGPVATNPPANAPTVQKPPFVSLPPASPEGPGTASLANDPPATPPAPGGTRQGDIADPRGRLAGSNLTIAQPPAQLPRSILPPGQTTLPVGSTKGSFVPIDPSQPEKKSFADGIPPPKDSFKPIETTSNSPFPGTSSESRKDPEPRSGNDRDVAPAPDGSGYPKTHFVEKGESYWAIASRHYKNGSLWPHIEKANPGVKLVPGKKLTIPAPPARPPQPEGARDPSRSTARDNESPGPRAPAQPPVLVASGYTEYVVKKNDTLSAIAKQFYKDAGKSHLIEEANQNLKYQMLQEGARIKVPLEKR